ncbi:lytic transglycosylase domain-containing protein [Chryseobacterium potabilaquae]|uniref:Membrane-bound lytic murein transglycosylase D n=1 Tax=Chryseobacterium potabilaquae TaxID=2675057 RepID=A0A6N4XFL3_9FLAO|nr:lytic transglycosylase domain-containing protein [Chryseobacterium potabilaquae]CAA7197448.1 Membrane-bound lytic murein transglycosylase D [Chryseobacterium potabilaquae]
MLLKNIGYLPIILIIAFAFFFSVELKSQQKEVFIRYNENYIKGLGESHDSNEDLHIDTFKERFSFLNSNTPLSIDYNDITYTYVRKYLSYKWYGKIIGLSTYYFPLFEKKLAQYGMPLELKYLAVVESALNPRAGSWAGAKGLWQFIPATGAQYGIKQNKYINIFFDPVGNTDSAVRYLKNLYLNLGDWNLAISAYNCGEGNVRKAIKKAGSKSYWKVRPFLPKETQAYVPSFIAVNYMFNFYKKHKINPSYFKYSFLDLKLIKTSKNTTFQELSKCYDLNLLKFSNPQFITNFIPQGSIVYVHSKISP